MVQTETKKRKRAGKEQHKQWMKQKVNDNIYHIQRAHTLNVTVSAYDILEAAGAVASDAFAAGEEAAQAGPEADPFVLGFWAAVAIGLALFIVVGFIIYVLVIGVKTALSSIWVAGNDIAKAFNVILEYDEMQLRVMSDDLVDAVWAVGRAIHSIVNPIAMLLGYYTWDEMQPMLRAWIHPINETVVSTKEHVGKMWGDLYGYHDAHNHWHNGVTEELQATQATVKHLTHEVDKLAGAVPSTYHLPKWVTEALSTLQSEYAGLDKEVFHHIEQQLKQIESEIKASGGHVPSGVQHELDTLTASLASLYHEVRHKDEAAITALTTELGAVQTQVHAEVSKDIRNIKNQLSGIQYEYETIAERLKKVEHTLNHLKIPSAVNTKKIWDSIDELQHQTSWLVRLAPMLQLLPLTVEQAGNLNKLKDKPCQCRSRAGTDNDDALWAAIAENIVANGF